MQTGIWDEGTFKEYIKDPKRKYRGPKWLSRGLRTRRKSTICGASSSSSDRMARRNEQFSPRFPMLGMATSLLFELPVMPGGGRTNNQSVRESSEERRLASQDQDDVMRRLLFGILINA
jgi:hypothetical protein